MKWDKAFRKHHWGKEDTAIQTFTTIDDKGKNDINHYKKSGHAHHLIQSFDPGETTPEQAHEIGKQLIDEITKGKYEYVLTSNVVGAEWELTIVLAGMYGLRRNEILGLRWSNVNMEDGTFAVVEQLPFKVPPKTDIIDEMAPVKSSDSLLPITESTHPYFERQLALQRTQKEMTELAGQPYHDNNLVISKPNGTPMWADRVSTNFGQQLRHLEMPHIRFHDLRHTAATNMHQLTGDFYTVGEILGHTLKGIGITLGISGNLDAVTKQYVEVRIDRKQTVLDAYHNALHPKKELDAPAKGNKRRHKSELDR